jgi:hypothetical protein
MEFDPFGLSVKAIATKSVLARYNSFGPLYTLHLPASPTSTPDVVSYAQSALLLLPRITISITLTSRSSPSCRVVQSSPVLGPQMIPYVMHVGLVDTLGYLFLFVPPGRSNL